MIKVGLIRNSMTLTKVVEVILFGSYVLIDTIILERLRMYIINGEEEQLVALEASYMKLHILVQNRMATS
jgi:hypothetical protein